MAMQLRVTQQSISSRVMTGLQNNVRRMGDLQAQLSSGRALSRPSDSPTGTVSALQLRGEIRTVEQYERNASDGIGWLGTLDNTLTSMNSQVSRVRDLVLQAKSDGTGGSPQAREALAVEVENIRESLIGLANTRYLDRPVFGGNTPGQLAYSPAGVYVGDASGPPAGQVFRTVAADTKVRVDLTGPEAFGSGATELFTVLQNVVDNMRGNPSALGGDLANLDTVRERVQTNLSGVGARYNRISTMRQTAEDRLLTLNTQLSDVEAIDLPATIMDLKLQETAYQAALAAGARVIQPSLIDFLR